MQVLTCYVIAALAVALLGLFAYRNHKQGWQRERYDFLQDLAELELVVYSQDGHLEPAAGKQPVMADTEARAEAGLRLLIRGMAEGAAANAPASEALTPDVLKLEQLVGRRDALILAERGAAALAALQQGVAPQLPESEQLAMRLRAVANASQTLDLLLEDLDLELYDAEVRQRIDNLRHFLSEFAAPAPVRPSQTYSTVQ